MNAQTDDHPDSNATLGPRGFLRRGLSRTLVTWFLLLALIPLLAVSFISYYTARDSLRDGAYRSLQGVIETKTEYLNTFFNDKLADLAFQAGAQSNHQLLASLRAAQLSSGQTLADFVRGEQWPAIAKEQAGELKRFTKAHGYWDILLIDVEGNILFTIEQEEDLGTNLFERDHAGMAATSHKALEQGAPVFSDLHQHHQQDEVDIVGFLARAMVDATGKKLGVIALQINMNEINRIMQESAGLGETGETYLIGTDLRMRSNSRLVKYATALGAPLTGGQTGTWLEGIGKADDTTGHQHKVTMDYTNFRGEAVFGSYESIDVGGVHLGVIAEIEQVEALAPATNLGRFVALLLSLTTLCVVITALVTAGRIVRPILALSAGASRVSRGDLEQEIKVSAKNEVGDLADSFNLMTRNLRVSRAKTEAQDWLKSGQAELNEAMRGEQDIGTLGTNILSFLCDYLNAQIGAIYVAGEDGHLRMVGSYAYNERKNLSNDFVPGDGLVGQAALEHKPIILDNCPEDYITIHSGLGEASPRNIMVHPVILDEVTKGVIELGSFEPFTPQQREFLNEVARAIAITINSVEAREKTVRLLQETQRQSEELQAQQEELKAANEELQSQQEELKSSNEELQSQQEELRTANEELEEQAKRLRASEESLKTQQEETEVANEELNQKNQLLEQQTREVEQARQNIEEKAEELAQASKYKSQFLANMSHELRSPLNSLLLLAESLHQNKEANLNDDQVEAAGIIYDSGYDLLSLINEILDLSKIEAGRMELHLETIPLTELADSVSNSFKHMAKEKGVAFEAEVGTSAPVEVVTDRQRFEQVVTNLVSNAVKFTEEGKVKVIFGLPETGVNYRSDTLVEGEVLAISVVDTGIGLAKDKHKIIFEAFQQADGGTARRYGGTGLGLSIARELARLLGGEIQFESELGKGSTFTLYIPLNKHLAEQAPAKRPAETSKPQVASRLAEEPATPVPLPFEDDRGDLNEGDRVLLVIEDDPKFAKILCQHARERQFRCVVALNGEDGLELALQLKPAAITLDLKLPGVSGWNVLGTLKENPDTRHIPVHIISALSADPEEARHGAIGHLTKPVSQSDLTSVFQRIEEISSRKLKRLLVVEDDATDRKAIVALLADSNIVIDEVETGKAALEALGGETYDCVILDLMLKDMNGDELLETLQKEGEVEIPPVVIYTARDLTHDEEMRLRELHASTIVLKDVRSQERLLDEVSLFLHSVVKEMPPGKQRIISDLHDTDAMLHGRKVMVVDDDMRTMFALTRFLQEHGIKTLKAENGIKALQLVEQNPDIELVLMDIMMPEMDGFETIEHIRAQSAFKQLPIIALTAKAMKEDRDRCLKVGASDYLSKPVQQDRLLSMMRVWLYR